LCRCGGATASAPAAPAIPSVAIEEPKIVTPSSERIVSAPPPERAAVPATPPAADAKLSEEPAVRLEPGAPARRAGAEPTGMLVVRSTPPGAQVSVDGQAYGKAPVTVGQLKRGSHRLRVEREGYVTQDRRVIISPAGGPLTVQMTLAPTQAASRNIP